MSYNPEKSSALCGESTEPAAERLEGGSAMVTATVEAHHWTREEYERLVETGAFEGWKVELVEGTLYDVTPQTSRHAGLTGKVAEILSDVDPGEHLLRQHSPLSVPGDSLPEPDIAVVPPDPAGDYYVGGHPNTAVLVVEIADSSLQYDREVKAGAYARAGIPEYWILNLVSGQLEVYREPAGDAYRSRAVLGPVDEISPLFAPGAAIRVAHLLPKQRSIERS
jgi:Uma2 family endonuclease